MSHARQRRRTAGGQGMVEMALVLPAFLALVSGCVDVGRYVYISGQITANTATAARLAAVSANQATDCAPLAAAKQSAGGFTIYQDQNSTAALYGSGAFYTSANITAGTGYVFISPAVATDANGTCAGSARATGGSVTVTTTLKFATLTPYMGRFIGNLMITVSSADPTGY